jgi:hypothetical protein
MIAMHQCEFCCWYVERYGTCECPTSMKRIACEKARRMKNRVNEDKWKELYENEKKNSILRD